MQNFLKVLGKLLVKLRKVDFALLGTFNLFLQGIKIEPHDLDLITDNYGIGKIADIFNSELTKNNSYLETEFFVDGVEVHVVSNENNLFRKPFRKNIIWVKSKKMNIPCQSLESELRFYRKVGRQKDKGKIELIQGILLKKK